MRYSGRDYNNFLQCVIWDMIHYGNPEILLIVLSRCYILYSSKFGINENVLAELHHFALQKKISNGGVFDKFIK